MKKYLLITIMILVLLISFIFLFPFKTDYSEIIQSKCEKYEIDKNLVFSIIKAESGFNQNAVSKVGAIGLMQILPSTGEWVSKKIGLNYKENDLYNAEINIEIGVYYLSYLIELFENNLENAICAYNAGQYTVMSWLNSKEYSDDGINLSKIPYNETKNYLTKVKFNKFIYSHFIIN